MVEMQLFPLNFFLVLAAGMEVILLWLLLRQKDRSFYITLYTYLTLLFLAETIASIFLLNAQSAEMSLLASKIRLITQCFILATIFNFSYLFKFSSTPPKLSVANIFPFLFAIILSAGVLLNFMIIGMRTHAGIYSPEFSAYYWLIILFFAAILFLIFSDLIKKYKHSRRRDEIHSIKEVLFIILPAFFIALFPLYILPFAGLHNPIIFAGYFLIAGLLLYSAFRFYIIEADESSLHIIPQMSISAFFLLLFFFFTAGQNSLPEVLLSIPGFLMLTFSAYYIYRFFIQIFSKLQQGYDALLESKIEEFSSNISKIIEPQQLWEYMAQFLGSNLNFKKIAIIEFEYDITPYQVVYLNGYEATDIRHMLEEKGSPILDAIEENHGILNKFDHPPDSVLYKKMDQYKIYLGLPLLKQRQPLGIIFLGGERRQFRIPRRQLQMLEIIGAQTAAAMDNIHTIQNTLQEKKLADIGMLASQLAHDFQSFISIVKMENPGNERLREQADYTQKMVQDLLNYARPQELHFTPININHLLDMSLDLVEIPPNILIEKQYASDLPEINVDITQIRRVFMNLFENSLRAMADGPGRRLKITTRTLRPLTKAQRNPWIYIEILDEGVGIPEEHLKRIFEPFYTTYKNQGGNGMGLAIVKQIITRHQGYIDVTSRPGKGTVFNIRIPYIIV